jgi:hypothetical protein
MGKLSYRPPGLIELSAFLLAARTPMPGFP